MHVYLLIDYLKSVVVDSIAKRKIDRVVLAFSSADILQLHYGFSIIALRKPAELLPAGIKVCKKLKVLEGRRCRGSTRRTCGMRQSSLGPSCRTLPRRRRHDERRCPGKERADGTCKNEQIDTIRNMRINCNVNEGY